MARFKLEILWGTFHGRLDSSRFDEAQSEVEHILCIENAVHTGSYTLQGPKFRRSRAGRQVSPIWREEYDLWRVAVVNLRCRRHTLRFGEEEL